MCAHDLTNQDHILSLLQNVKDPEVPVGSGLQMGRAMLAHPYRSFGTV